jgi:hypothetical protein
MQKRKPGQPSASSHEQDDNVMTQQERIAIQAQRAII